MAIAKRNGLEGRLTDELRFNFGEEVLADEECDSAQGNWSQDGLIKKQWNGDLSLGWALVFCAIVSIDS